MAEESAVREEQKPGEGEEAAPAAAKGPLIPPILVRYSIVGGILAAMAVGAIFLVTDVIAPRLKRLGESTPAAAEVTKTEAVHEPGEVIEVKDLIVNPAGSAGRRYLKVAAVIEVASEKGKKKKEKAPAAEGAGGGLQEAQIRDLLIRELSARTLDELTDPVTKEEMRQGILEGLSGILGEGRVTALYFTEYVVQ
jgi:flagellar basal body-associated protein FliL